MTNEGAIFRDVHSVTAQPFTDPELGERYYLRWTNRGRRCSGFVLAVDLDKVRAAIRGSVVISDPWDPNTSDEHRALMAKLSATP